MRQRKHWEKVFPFILLLIEFLEKAWYNKREIVFPSTKEEHEDEKTARMPVGAAACVRYSSGRNPDGDHSAGTGRIFEFQDRSVLYVGRWGISGFRAGWHGPQRSLKQPQLPVGWLLLRLSGGRTQCSGSAGSGWSAALRADLWQGQRFEQQLGDGLCPGAVFDGCGRVQGLQQ